MKDLCLAGRS